MLERNNPLVALVLSLIVPGLGQIYNRDFAKGLVVFGLCLGLGLLTYGLSGLNKITAALALVVIWISAITEAYMIAKASGQPIDFYYHAPYVIAMLLLVGPLALPLLWRSPHFSRFARWCWTILVVAAALLFVLTPYFMNCFINHDPQLAPTLRN
jgi:TM2 domain-containing membrane protein YozV